MSFTSIDFSTQNQLFHGSESTVLVSKAQITTISQNRLVVSNSATFSFKLCGFSISSPNLVTTGLLKTEDNWSGLQVISSRLTNVTMSHESCLTGDALTRSVEMISSQVLNLSTTTPTTDFSAAPSISPYGISSVVGSDWVDTSNAFYGQIVGDLNSHSNMFLINNTHIHSVRKEWYFVSNAVITEREVVTTSKTCTGDTFNGCHPTSNGEGGAFCIEGNDFTVNLTSCTFVACYASEGGVIRLPKWQSEVTMITDRCTFNDCYATGQTGVFRSHQSGTDTITDCKFNNCYHPTAGTLFFIYSNPDQISGCTFTGCEATTGSHSVIETYGAGYLLDFLFSDCSIIGCNSATGSQMYFVDKCTFQSLVFHDCTVTNQISGDVRGGYKHADLPSYSSNHMPHFNAETAELEQTINFPPWKVTVDGVDEEFCGFYDKKCLSVAYVLTLCTAKNRARTAYAMQAITLLDATHAIPAIPLGEQTITIQGLKTGSDFNTQFTASTPTTTFLSVTTGRFFVNDLHLLALSGGVFLEVAGTGQGKVTGCKMDTTTTGTMNTAFATLATGTLTIETSTFTGLTLSATALIRATSGTLTIKTLTASSINLAKDGLITTSGTTVSVTGSTFTSISNENGDGGVLSLTLGASNSLTVKTSSFKLDSATGRGGAVFVSTTSTVAQTDAVAPFLTYGWDNEMCSATLGENVLVSCSSVSTELASRKWTTLKPALPERNLITAERETFKIVDGTSSEKLLYHWYPHTSGEVHLHSVGEDHTNCGVLELACVTMETAMTNMKTMKVVLIDSAFVRSTVFQSTAETWTLRQSSGCSLTLQGDGQIQIPSGVNSALTLDTLTLGVGTLTSGRSTSLFSVETGSLSFSSCKLTLSSTIPSTLSPISITGGTLIITSGTVSLPTTLSRSFLSSTAGTTTISAVSLANSALSESLMCGTGTMSVKNCSFSALTSNSTISFTVGASQTLSIGESGKTTTFSGCSSSTDGGAICCFVGETGKLVVVSTSFSDCSSSRNGGSIFLSLTSTDLNQNTWNFDLSGALFTTDSTAEGAAVFVSGSFFETAVTTSRFPTVSSSTSPTFFWGTDSKTTVSSSLLVYLVEIEDVVSVSGHNSHDIDDCGHFGVPCVSVGKGLLRAVPSSNSIQIKVHANSPLKSSYSVASSLSVSIVGDVQASNGYLTVTTIASDTLIASAGSLSISQLAFTGTSGRSVSLFQLSSGGSLALTLCSFSGFSSSVAGSIVSGTSSVSNGLKLTNVDFSSCSSSLDGGVIAVTVSSSSSLALSESVSFTDCSSGTSNGHNMHITSSDLSAVLANYGSGGILDSILPSVGSTGIFTSAEKKKFWGVETQTGGSSGSLLFFRHPHTTGAVHLHVNGEDHLHCGETTLPCESLAHSLTSMKSANEVIIYSLFTLSTVFTSPQPLWTLSASSTNSLTLTQDAQLSLTSSQSSTVTLSSLPITIGSLTPGRTTPLFSVETGSLSFSDCSLAIPSTIPATLNPIAITEGTIVLTSGTVSLPTTISKSFLSSTGGTTTISAVSFANSALSEPLISGTGTMSVKNCSFSALTSKSTISFTVGDSQTLSIGESGKTTTFSGCWSSTDGGAICCFVGETGKLVVVSTSFSGCSSSGSGGSIFLSLTSTNNAQRTWDFDLRGASFTTDSSAEGAAVYVSGSFFESAITPTRFPTVSSSTPETPFWGTDSNSTVSSSLLVYLLPISNIVSVGGTGSIDIDDCGHFGVSCASLPHSHGRISASLLSTLVISVAADLTMSGEVAHNDDKALSIEGTAPFSISLDSSAHFAITKGSLAFSNISFALSSSLNSPLFEITSSELSLDATTAFATTSAMSFSHPLFLLNSGSLSLEQTAFSFVSTLTLTETSLIVVNDGSLVIDACSIANIHSSSDGSVVNAHVTESGSLSVSQCTFSHCSSDGNGGVLHVSCDVGVPSSSLLVNSNFDASCTCGVSGKGKWVYVEGHDFVSLITPLNWKLTSANLVSPLNDNLLSGEDLAEEVEDVNYRHITLLYFLLFYSNETIYSGANGRDAAGCGQIHRPCDTLAIAHTHLSNVDQDTLFVVKSSELKNTMELGVEDFKLTRKSGETEVSVVVKENGMILNEHAASTSHSISIDHLVFNLSAAACSSLIKSNNGELSIASCSFEASLPIAFILLDLEGGQTTLSQTTILVSTTTGSLFKVSAGKLTVGSLLLTALTFSTPAIILENSAFANITGLELTDTETQTLISASNSTLHIQVSQISGKTPSTPSHNSNELCEWGTGFVNLDNCSTHLTSTSFTHFAQGALLVSNGNVTLTMSSFSDNTPGHSVFTSARRNVECSGNGKIVIPSLGGGDGSSDKLPSAWMALKDECVVESTIVEEYEAMFVAKLNTAQSNATHHRNKTFSVMLIGELFIPCGLGLEIYGILNNTQKEPVVLPFTSLTPSVWNETQIHITLNETELNKQLDPEAAWHARIVFGKGGCTESIQLKLTGAENRKALTTQVMKWLIPVIVAVLVVIVFIIVIVVLCRRRKNKDQKDTLAAKKEMDFVQDMGEIKMDEMETQIAPTLGTTAFVFENNAEVFSLPPPSSGFDGVAQKFNQDDVCENVKVVGPTGAEMPMLVSKRDTLYNRLHKNTDLPKIDKRTVQMNVVKGIQALASAAHFDALLKKMSPHSIQLVQDDEVVFRIDNPMTAGATNNRTHTGPSESPATVSGGNEGERWQAPETRIGQHESNTATPNKSTPTQAAVFSLGLILQEIETGMVPFGELDAQNAQRQLGTGLIPPMIGIEDEEFIEMIRLCLSLNPDERPKLKDLDDFFTKRNGKDKKTLPEVKVEDQKARTENKEEPFATFVGEVF